LEDILFNGGKEQMRKFINFLHISISIIAFGVGFAVSYVAIKFFNIFKRGKK